MSFALSGDIGPRGSDFSGKASTDAPTLLSAIIASDGATISLTFDEAVTFGAGGNGGVTLSASGGATTATYSSGDTTATLVYSLSRSIDYGETVTVSYTQPGDGIEAVDDAADVNSFSNTSATNISTLNRPVATVSNIRRLRRF